MTRQTRHTWPAERTERTVALWNQGWSKGQIGRELGVSGNAVIGKLHRMGLTNETRNPGAKRALRSAQAPPSVRRLPKPPKSLPPAAVETAVMPLNIRMRDISDGQCRWPMWQTDSGWPDFHLCGLATTTGSPYCGDHARKGMAGKIKAAKPAEEVAA